MARREHRSCVAVSCFDFALSTDAILNAAKHLQQMLIYRWPCAPLPAPLLTVFPDPRLCLSFFLRRRHIPQPPHPPHRAGPVPAAAHHRAASLVLPQVNSPALQGLTHLTSTPPWASLTGCEPGSGGRAQGDKHFLL